MMPLKQYISWNQFYEDTKTLVEKIRLSTENIKGVVCITRGGLIPTGIISSLMNLRKIETFCMKSYSDKQEQIGYTIFSLPNEAIEDQGKNWIIIDEITDTGQTAEYVMGRLPLAKLFSVYTKVPHNKDICGYAKSFEKNIWLCFPWEEY